MSTHLNSVDLKNYISILKYLRLCLQDIKDFQDLDDFQIILKFLKSCYQDIEKLDDYIFIMDFLRSNLTNFNHIETIPDLNNDIAINDFLKSCYLGDFDSVLNYVVHNDCDPYVTDKYGRSGLLYAVLGNRIKIIEFLMRRAPGIQLIRTINGTSIFQVAITNGTLEAIKEILILLPRAFHDSRLIALKTLEYFNQSYNALLSPEELAINRGDNEIIELIQNFKSKLIKYYNDNSKIN